jgi:hypothetical protein
MRENSYGPRRQAGVQLMDMIKRAGAHSGDQTYPTGWLCDVHTASALRLKCVVGTGPPRALHLRSGRRTMNREQGEQNSPVPQAGVERR